MIQQILIGLLTEGSTDQRFLTSVVKRTFELVSFDCRSDIEILEIVQLNVKKSTFVEDVIKASQQGTENYGITVLCVHADADASTDEHVYNYKINPAIRALKETGQGFCTNLVAIVPVQMQEAWLLADKTLLKRHIGTDLSDQELNIHRHPESIADPKETIENAIRTARQSLTRRRRKDLRITELYQPIGQSIDMNRLVTLASYRKFEANVRSAYRDLHLLDP